jgi:hypothetical protein
MRHTVITHRQGNREKDRRAGTDSLALTLVTLTAGR